MSGYHEIATILFAFLLDMIFGDPKRLPHPVRWMGKLITVSEKFWQKKNFSPFISGSLMTISLITLAWFLTYLFLFFMHNIHSILYWISSVVIIYFSLSASSLAKEAKKVYQALNKEDINKARKVVAGLVSRDTEKLSFNEIARATVESVSENLGDGVISPLFYATVGGAPLVFCYKMINTLDSMIGYKNKRYILFGKFAAKIDDLANFIPARFAIFIIPLSSIFLGCSPLKTFKIILKFMKANPSPNAGIYEAAFAGALNIKLGGINYYNHKEVKKEIIGVGDEKISVHHIKKAINLMLISSFFFLIIFSLLIYIGFYFWPIL